MVARPPEQLTSARCVPPCPRRVDSRGHSARRGHARWPALAAGDDDGDKNTLLAEAQFQLFLVTANYEPTDITCTPPPIRDEDGQLLCYALISDRVSVAAIATMESPGVYTFVPLNKVDPADLSGERAAGEEITPQQPPIPDSPTPTSPADDQQGSTDEAVLASIGYRRRRRRGLSSLLTDNNPSIISVDLLAYDAPTSTVQVSVSTTDTDPVVRDDVAFFVTDIMAYLWMEGEPTRERDATIHPRLEVTVDGVIYGTPFDVMVAVADYAITQGEWLDIVTGTGAYGRVARHVSKVDVKRSTPTQSVSAGATLSPPPRPGLSTA